MKSKWFGAIIVAFLDLCMFNLSFWMAYAISVLIYGSKILPKGTYTNIITFANFILLIIFFSLGLYRRKRSLFDSEDFYLLLESVILCYLIITAATFLSKSMDYSRLIVTNTFVISLFMISLARSTLSILLARTMARWSDKQRAAILGRTKIGESILKKLKESPELGYDFVGFMEFNTSLKDELKKRRIQTLFV